MRRVAAVVNAVAMAPLVNRLLRRAKPTSAKTGDAGSRLLPWIAGTHLRRGRRLLVKDGFSMAAPPFRMSTAETDPLP